MIYDGRYSTCTLTHCAVVNLPTTHCALNRPSPDEVEADDRCGVTVLTREGTAFSAGMDIKGYFRDMRDQPRLVNLKVHRRQENGFLPDRDAYAIRAKGFQGAVGGTGAVHRS